MTTLTLKINETITLEITITVKDTTPVTVTADALPMTPVSASLNSSVLRFATYHPDSRTLVLTFKSGRSYRYDDVPRGVFDDLTDGRSVGEFYNERIKPFFQAADVAEFA